MTMKQSAVPAMPAGSSDSSGSSDHPAGEGGTAAGDPAQTANHQSITALNKLLVTRAVRRIAELEADTARLSAELEADTARLSAEVALLRKRPEPPAAVQRMGGAK